MYWTEDNKASNKFIVPDNIIDVVFDIKCKMLPLDHAHALSQALHEKLPWLQEETQAGIHQIYGAESGNGWMRPEDPENEVLVISRRQKMTLRIPKQRLDAIQDLIGAELDIDGYTLTVGNFKEKKLSDLPTLFARFVMSQPGQSEDQFMQAAAQQLQQLGIQVRKMMAGKERILRTADDVITTRALMLAELQKEHSVKLQEEGLGEGRKLGCGLFLPQKGIAAVNEE